MLNFIKKVLENNLGEEEKFLLLQEVASKTVTPIELAEIVGYIKSRQSFNIHLPDSIDICGTGGSGLDRINTSTLACIELSKKGIKVAKHGNNASSGRFGSFDLIQVLGYHIPNSQEEILNDYHKNNIAFLYAKNFYPFLKTFQEARKKYGKPTLFNILGPLLNPANSNYQIIGCAFHSMMHTLIEACKILGRKNILIVRGYDGLDEITLSGKTKVFELRNGKISHYEIIPEDYGFRSVKNEEILCHKIDEKIKISQKIISGEKCGAYSDLVNLNVQVALNFLTK